MYRHTSQSHCTKEQQNSHLPECLSVKTILCENSHALNCLTDTGHSHLYTSSLFMQLQVFHNFHSISHLDKYRTYHLLTNHQFYSQIIFIGVNFEVIQHVISKVLNILQVLTSGLLTFVYFRPSLDSHSGTALAVGHRECPVHCLMTKMACFNIA